MDSTRADNVCTDGGRVWIPSVPDVCIGTGWDMLMRAAAALLRYRGEKVTPDALTAHSGDAFSLCHVSHGYGISHLCIPTNTVSNAAAAFGYSVATIADGCEAEMKALPRERRVQLTRAALERIYCEVDAGRPIMVGGAEDDRGYWSVVVGYDRDADLLCHIGDGEPYRWAPIRGLASAAGGDDAGYWKGDVRGAVRDGFVGGALCNPAFAIGEKADAPVPRLDGTLDALRRAVMLHTAPSWQADGLECFFGVDAYDEWAQALEGLEVPEEPGDVAETEWERRCICDLQMRVDLIVHGRAAAAEFCRYATVLMRGAADSMLAAADAYDRECAVAYERLPAFTEGTQQNRIEWLRDGRCRMEGADAIRAMLEEEVIAIEQIENALGRI